MAMADAGPFNIAKNIVIGDEGIKVKLVRKYTASPMILLSSGSFCKSVFIFSMSKEWVKMIMTTKEMITHTILVHGCLCDEFF
jgi:hypothetical protein